MSRGLRSFQRKPFRHSLGWVHYGLSLVSLRRSRGRRRGAIWQTNTEGQLVGESLGDPVHLDAEPPTGAAAKSSANVTEEAAGEGYFWASESNRRKC